jgi:hypothetical protein
MGHPSKDIILQVHFSLDILVLFHIFELHLYIFGIDSQMNLTFNLYFDIGGTVEG